MPATPAPSSLGPSARPAVSSTRIALALLTLYVVWGSTYLGIKVAIVSIPPLTQCAIRFLIAGSLLYVLTIRRGDAQGDRPGLREWRDAAIIGGLLLAGGNGLVAVGEQTVPSGVAALLIATLPIWVAVIGRVAFGVVLTRPIVAGIVIGFVGVVVLVEPGAGGTAFTPLGVGALLLSPALWATGSLYSRTAHLPRRPLVATAMQMLAGSAILWILAVVSGDIVRLRLEDVTPTSVAAVGYLIVVGSLVGFTAYVWLLRVAPISLVSTYAYVNPIIAVFLGWLILAEPLEPRTIAAGAIILVAVAVIVRARAGESRAIVPEELAEPA